ncbi:MAG: membrane integrity-associated transporter subunit PqiC [Nitrospiraceae bacterium]|nr:membrane integrity-associated transporter subunit PqiC [Nitrospira sp.]MCA9457542.1 membrane integrity-associated transporter subunit PqiC [Nitrospira sp.]MCB9773890.1 membrane integrity-associated transporter subunit PqiC [Nitrospiraceae bacterium]
MDNIIHGFRFIMVFVIFLTVLGCGTSQPSHFYVLRALAPSSVSGLSHTKVSNLSFGLGPVTLPKYLDRPQIVTQSGGHEVQLAEFHKWAEPLSENVSRVLAENLSVILSTDRIEQYPWRRTTPVDYQIVVDVLQFDGTRGGEAVLSARWRLVGGDEQTVFTTRKTHVTHHQASQDYEGLVEAMSHNLEDLSREIAESMKMLLPTNLPGSIS